MSFREPTAPRTGTEEALTRADLIGYFHSHIKAKDQWLVGAEFEKMVVTRADGTQVAPKAKNGPFQILEEVANRFGWQIYREGGQISALTREDPEADTRLNKSSMTMEPGGQIELATPPCKSLVAIERSLLRHRAELLQVVSPEHTLIAAGLTPYSTVSDLELTGRERHNIMFDYLPEKGALAGHMMKATTSVQVALDYGSEADAAKKFFTALGLSPLTTALFSNSALHEGQDSGFASFRGKVWRQTDDERSGLLSDVMTSSDSCFEVWTDFMASLPMMFFAINDIWEPAHGRTFKSWMEKGHKGVFPSLVDWELHLTSVFTEVRLKNFVEIRGADSVPPALAMAFPALCKGLLYDEGALDEAHQLALELGSDSRDELFDLAYQGGLSASFRGRPLGQWVGDIVKIARKGLDAQGLSESVYLDPAEELLEGGKSMGEKLSANLKDGSFKSRQDVLKFLAY